MKNKFILIFSCTVLLVLGFWIGQILSSIFELSGKKEMENNEEVLREADIEYENFSSSLRTLKRLCPNLGNIDFFEGKIEEINAEYFTGKGSIFLCWPLQGRKETKLKIVVNSDTNINKWRISDNCETVEEELDVVDLKNGMFVNVKNLSNVSDDTFIAEEIIVRSEDFWEELEKCS